MNLYAFDETGDFIFANEALSSQIYFCIDCGLFVKKRKSKHFFPHFYHLKTSPRCRFFHKTEGHFLFQLQLQAFFPKQEIVLEKPFPQIRRIADVFWEKKKIIFEIQCSLIQEEEVNRRILDYRSLGYEIIWLLDDKIYNRKFARTSERFLRERQSYYVSIKKDAPMSKIYDQFEVFEGNKRVRKGRPLEVEIKTVLSRSNVLSSGAPKQIKNMKGKFFCKKDRSDPSRDENLLKYWKNQEEKLRKGIFQKIKKFLSSLLPGVICLKI